MQDAIDTVLADIKQELASHLRAISELIEGEGERLFALHEREKALLDISKVASRLDVSKRTVDTLLAKGDLPPPIWINSVRRWSPATIDAYILSRAGQKPRKGRRRVGK